MSEAIVSEAPQDVGASAPEGAINPQTIQTQTIDVGITAPAGAPAPSFGATSVPEVGAPKFGAQATDRGWLENIPDEFREGVSKFGSPSDLAKAYVNAQQLIGKKSVGLMAPEEGATDEQVKQFRAELAKMNGVPESADKYDLRFGEGDNAINYGEHELGKLLIGEAHKAGLNNEQLRGIMERFGEYGESVRSARENEVRMRSQENDRILIEHYKSDYEPTMQRINGFVAKNMTSDLYDAIEANGWLNEPLVVEFLDSLSKGFAEDSVVEQRAPISAESRIDTARKSLGEIMRLPDNDSRKQKLLDENLKQYKASRR